jgi:hypothetical protein
MIDLGRNEILLDLDRSPLRSIGEAFGALRGKGCRAERGFGPLADTKGRNYSCCQQKPEAFFVRRLQRTPFWVIARHCAGAILPLVAVSQKMKILPQHFEM